MTHADSPATQSVGGRAARREALHDMVMTRAEVEAATVGRALRCQWGQHAPRGCANNGSTCICECHDPEEAT